jgi:glutamine synthetase
MKVARTQTAADLREFAEEHGIRTFRAGGVDIDGLWRAKHVPAESILESKLLSYSNFVFGIDIHDQLYTPNLAFTGWKTGWPDFRMIPDPSTARAIPWEPGIATLICDYASWEGEPIEFAPRQILRQVTERFRNLGFEPKVAVELEFFVLRETPDSLAEKDYSKLEFLTRGNHSYHPFRAANQLQGWMDLIREFGVPLDGANAEWGAGQYEINLHYGTPIDSADNTLMYKHIVKELAAREGLTVTFMARLAADQPGNSGHLHMSLWDRDGEQNLFWDQSKPHGISDLMRHYVGGLMTTMREFAVLYLPFINSYRRILEYLSSPTSVTWGIENRTTGLRAVPHTENGCRIEHRIPGADSNPYLTIAAGLAGGAYGVERELEPPDLLFDDGYAAEDAPQLPRTLEEAVELFEKSDLAREVFGDQFVSHYVGTRRWEIEQYRQAVTDWERQRYLEMV